MNVSAAAAVLECQLALVVGSTAAHAALEKHQASIAPKLAYALGEVGSYGTSETSSKLNSYCTRFLSRANAQHGRRSPLNKAVLNGDAATVEALIVAGPKLDDIVNSDCALATDETSRNIVEHHAAVYISVLNDPSALVFSALGHCASLSASEVPLPATSLSLRAYHFDPFFLWAPFAARVAVFTWARNVFIAQLAATIQLFEDLPDDCGGDALEFFGITHKEAELIAKHCSTPEARAWVRAVVTAALAVTRANATIDLGPAAEKGDLATVQACLSKKANIETIVRCGRTALLGASANGHTAIVEVLLKAGADKEATDKWDGSTALILASKNGHTAILQLLLGAGANGEAKTTIGSSALIEASRGGHAATVTFLLKIGADKDAEDMFGHTALNSASRSGDTATVQVLLGAGADKEAKEKPHGWTALLAASAYGHTAIVEVLLKAGADKEAKSNDGKTACDEAEERGHTAVAAFLKRAET